MFHSDSTDSHSFQPIENPETFLPDFFETSKPTAVFVLTDKNSHRHCLPLLKSWLPKATTVIQIPAGEMHKQLETCSLVWEKLTRKNADRKAILLNLGGGVVGDLGGFCASAYKRGIDFIQIPTSLLAMVDASLGGKTGVDFLGFKNQIGTFNSP